MPCHREHPGTQGDAGPNCCQTEMEVVQDGFEQGGKATVRGRLSGSYTNLRVRAG